MQIYKNISNEAQNIQNIGIFNPGETKKVNSTTAKRLDLSPHFVEVKGDAEAKDKPK